MTVSDPTGDVTAKPYVVGFYASAVAAKPAAFDVQRATVMTTDRMLCASVRFAAGGPKVSFGGTVSRQITLELAPRRLRPDDTRRGPLGRLLFGMSRNAAQWLPNGAMEDSASTPVVVGERTAGLRGREVQIAVPLSPLQRINGYREGVPDARLDPRSFSWRVSVPSDCAPGPRQLFTFPPAAKLSLPARTQADLSRICR